MDDVIRIVVIMHGEGAVTQIEHCSETPTVTVNNILEEHLPALPQIQTGVQSFHNSFGTYWNSP